MKKIQSDSVIPACIQRLLAAVSDMRQLSLSHIKLLEIQQKKTGQWVEDETSIFTKGGLTLLCAAWEAYIEDSAREATIFLIDNIRDPKDLPKNLRKAIAKEIKETSNDLSPWELAGNGWRAFIKSRFENLAMAGVNQLNTPKSNKIKDLYFKTLGIEDITKSWTWEMYNQKITTQWIDRLVSLRGSIAHGRNPDIVVGSYIIMFLTQLVIECAYRTHNHLVEHLAKLTEKNIWRTLFIDSNWERFEITKKEPPKPQHVIACLVEGTEHYAELVPDIPD